MILYRCHDCTALLETVDQMAWRAERCPLCGGENVVPRAEHLYGQSGAAAAGERFAPPAVREQPDPAVLGPLLSGRRLTRMLRMLNIASVLWVAAAALAVLLKVALWLAG